VSLRDNSYQVQYISGIDNLVEQFYIPSLKQARLYQRRTGYFNARSLALASRGFSALLRKPDAKVQLICSVELDREEADVLGDPAAFVARQAVEVLQLLEEPKDAIEKKRLGLLAKLLQENRLEIRVAVPRTGGIYHEKAGIFTDGEGNRVAFNGSGNETPGGWLRNTESFHAFTSWEDARHVRPEVETFERLWSNTHPGTTVVTLPDAVRRGILRFVTYAPEEGEPSDPGDPMGQRSPFEWTPELAYAFEAPRLWNREEFAFAETGVTPYEHQDYIASTVLESWPPRFLLADEVGLGKTIEAGLILRGLRGAGHLSRVLILAPKNLLHQWQEELLTKFNIDTWRLEGRHVVGPKRSPDERAEREEVDAENPFRSKPILIVSSQLLRAEERVRQALALEYDLVVVDEAHHARARGKAGKRITNRLLEALQELRLRTQGLLLLTATPMQLDRRELWDLLSLLELPGRWQDEDQFDRFYQQLSTNRPDWPLIFALLEDARKAWSTDASLLSDLREDYPGVNVHALLGIVENSETGRLLELSERDLEALKVLCYRMAPLYRLVFRNTRELLKRYRAEGKFHGGLADRETSTHIVPMEGIPSVSGASFSPTSEWGLYQRIGDYVAEAYTRYEGIQTGLGFVMVTYQKRLTSSFFAIRKSLERRQETLRHLVETQDTTQLGPSDEDLAEEDDPELQEEIQDVLRSDLNSRARAITHEAEKELEFLHSFLEDLRTLNRDSKAEHLEDLLREEFSRGTLQVIVFSQFKDTVDYLLDRLRPIYGERLGSFTGEGGRYWRSGRWVSCPKQDIQERFADTRDDLSLLICTDAASEGLNLQTCHVLINYDLPWNPMRIEQRIGRVDRIGQEAPRVRVHTMLYRQTVEGRVYERCLERIGDFRTALGHLQPILQETARIIREASMSPDAAKREEILNGIDQRYEAESRSVAEIDQVLRSERLLRSYRPRLPTASRSVPLSQQELEDTLGPVLILQGWHKENSLWTDGSRRITFDATLNDRKVTDAVYVSHIYPLASLFPPGQPEPPREFYDGRRRVNRLLQEGVVGYVVGFGENFHLVASYRNLSEPTGPAFSSVEEAQAALAYRLDQNRQRWVDEQRQAWQRRYTNWESRAGLYLDRVAAWRWKLMRAQAGSGGAPSYESFLSAWAKYLHESERDAANRLSTLLGYHPPPEIVDHTTRGRISKEGPRNARTEQALLHERLEIDRHLELYSPSVAK
jgi:ERCC4-related helicase